MFEIHDSIRNLPGATAARKLLTSRALQYLDSLAKEASGDDGLRRELATAYERVGDVQGKPRTPSLGDTKGALESYRKSLALRQALARNPGDVQDLLGLAGISREISELLAVSGDVNGALEYANQAVAVASSISNTDAAGREARLTELLSDYIARGVIEYSSIPRGGLQRPEAALQDYQRGLETATELLKYNPNNRSAVHQKAVIYERRGRILLLTGQPDAIQHLRVSLDIFRTLAADPNDAHAQRNLGASISMFADALSFDGRFREALAYYREELTIFQKLSNADPNDLNARMSLGGSYYDVGACLMRQGRLGEALMLIQHARSVAEESVAVDPKSVVEWGALADCRIAEAETFGRMDQPSKALQSYRAARAIYTKLSRSDEHDVDARLMGAATDAKIAATLLQPGDLVPAQEIFRQAVEASEPAANAFPPNQEAQYTLAAAYAGLGDIASRFAVSSPNPAQRTAHWTEATSWYEKSLLIWRAIPNRNRGFIDPNGFDAGDPEVVASALRRSTAALQQIAKRER
jgi:tetratricopeptide (TPR) repeat protein